MKKAFSLLLVCLLVLAAALPASALALGDVDGDGRVSAKDARLALRISARLENSNESQRSAADADGDGNVSAKDARIILRVSARLTTFAEARNPQPPAEELYRPLLNAFRRAASNGWQGYAYNKYPDGYPVGEYFLLLRPQAREIGYALFDLDGDGIRELLISKSDDNSGMIGGLYTIRGGRVTHVASSTQRVGYYLRADGRIYEFIFGGAMMEAHRLCALENGELVPKAHAGKDLTRSGSPYVGAFIFYRDSYGNWGLANPSDISQAEYSRRVSQYGQVVNFAKTSL